MGKEIKKMNLIGFGEETKRYRVYDPKNGCIVSSRDVVIIEQDEEIPIIVKSDSVGAM